MRSHHPRSLVLLLSAGLVLAGCGSTTILHSAHASTQTPTAASVIRAWSAALRSGNVKAAARYFALPSEFANGTGTGALDVVTIRTEAEAIVVNSELSCGSVVVSTHPDGRYVNAVFRLTNRSGPGGGCGSGAGELASTDFLIKGGQIVAWIRAPDPSGGATSTTPPLAPGTGNSI